MIAVDSTVWIDHLRDTPTAQIDYLRDVIRSRTTLLIAGDLVLCEVLQGLANERQARQVEAALRGFTVEPMVGAGIATQAAANYRTPRGLGITARRTIDMLIGTYCIEAGHSRSGVRSCRPRQKSSFAVLRRGRSRGRAAHWQPVPRICMRPPTTSRTSTVRLLPPRQGGGIRGPIRASNRTA